MADDAALDAWLTDGKPSTNRPVGQISDLVQPGVSIEEVEASAGASLKERKRQEILSRSPEELKARNTFLLEERYRKENTRDNVNLDTQSGMPAGLRLELSFLREMPDKVRVLQQKYPGLVRMSNDNVPIVRVTDDNGQQRDVLLDERRASLKDFVDVAGVLPELAGSVIGWRAGKAIPAKGGVARLRDMLTSAGAAQTAGVLTDIAARRGHGLETKISEILETRGKSAALDVAIDAATLGSGKVIGTGVDIATGRTAPFLRHQTEVQRSAMEAVNRIEAKTGIKIDLTAAEQTGSPALSRLEAFAEAAGGKGPAQERRLAREDKLRAVQNYMLGTTDSPVPSAEAIGKEALGTLEDRAKTLAKDVKTAEQGTVTTATAEVGRLLDEASLPQRGLLKRDIGRTVRQRAIGEREAFQAESGRLYEETYKLEGGRDRIFETASLSKKAEEALHNLPPKTKTVEVIDYDAYGSPTARTKEGKEVDKEFVPAGVEAKLRALAANPSEKRSLKDLVAMRTEVRNEIKRGEAIPGVQTHHLGEIHDMLTGAIKESTESMPSGELKDAWKKANDYYAKNVGRFKKRGIAELFREGDVPGSVGDAQIVGRILGNSEQANDRYFAMKEFLGEASGEWKNLKRAMLDDLYEGSLDSVSGRTLDAPSLLKKLDGLDREIRKDLFGAQEARLRSDLNILGVAQGSVPVEAVQALLDKKSPSLGMLNAAIAAEAKKSKEYKKAIMRMVTSGDVVEAQIKPDEFVDRFVSLAGKEEIDEAMAMLAHNPKLVESIQRKALEQVFVKARRSPSAIDIAKGVNEDPTMMVSGKSLLDAMGKTPSERMKLRAVIGDDQYNLLADYARVTASEVERDRLGGMAGALTGGSIINNLITKGLTTTTLEALAKYRLVQWMIANPAARAWTARPYSPSDWSDLATAAIVSTPFLEAMIEDSTSDGALHRTLKGFKQAAGLEQQAQPTAQPADSQQLDQWLTTP